MQWRPSGHSIFGGAARALPVALLGLVFLGPVSGSAHQHEPLEQQDPAAPFDRDTALAISQAAIGKAVGNQRFTDAAGKAVSLADFHGRPVVLSMIFTSCYHTCPLITRNLANTVGVAREALGDESFVVLTVGFDWQNDSPQRMASFAKEQGIDIADWHFLSGDEASIQALADDLGFIFYPSPRGFDHLAQSTVIDARGKVHWQVYGATFDAPHLVEPLKQLVFEGRSEPLSLAGWIEGVKFFCTIYDPASGRYRFDYSIFVALLAGIVSLGGVAIFIAKSWRHSV